jgi:phosphatidylglycerol:prolipoprotein diacylglycerol transferase
VHPVLFRIPGIDWPLHSYGVLIVIGFLFALYIAKREAERHGKYADEIMDFAFWALLGGMIGARVVFIIVNWQEYLAHPVKIIKIWEGGLVFYGAALGGLAAFLWYSAKHNIRGVDKLMMADMMVVGVPLAHAFGRLGCVAAGCCWGEAAYHLDAAGQVVSDIPLAAYFPTGSLAYTSLVQSEAPEVVARMREMGTTMPLVPTQLIEAFAEGLVFLALITMRSRKWFHGQVILSYGILYPIVRSTVEMFRGDTERGIGLFGLSTSQLISIGVAGASLTMIFILRKRGLTQTARTPDVSKP